MHVKTFHLIHKHSFEFYVCALPWLTQNPTGLSRHPLCEQLTLSVLDVYTEARASLCVACCTSFKRWSTLLWANIYVEIHPKNRIEMLFIVTSLPEVKQQRDCGEDHVHIWWWWFGCLRCYRKHDPTLVMKEWWAGWVHISERVFQPKDKGPKQGSNGVTLTQAMAWIICLSWKTEKVMATN